MIVNNNYKEIDDGIANLRSLSPADYLISDYTHPTTGYIKNFSDNFQSTEITYPDTTKGKT